MHTATLRASSNCSSSGLDSNLSGSNSIMSTFEDADKIFFPLVDSLLHILVVIHPLLDVVAEYSQLCQLLLDVLRHLHLLQVHHSCVQDSNSSLQTLLCIGEFLTVSLSNTKLVVGLSN